MKKQRKGAVLVLGIFFILMIFAAMGYFYEVSRATLAKMRAQNAADAQAMSAQIVLSNLRNSATTHYMLAEITRKGAIVSSQMSVLSFLGLTGYSLSKKDPFVQDLPDNTAADFVKAYHFFAHTQDFFVTRFLATYDSKIFLRDFLYKEARNHFPKTRDAMKYFALWLAYFNLWQEENFLEENEWGWGTVSFDREPSWAPPGLQVDYGDEVDGPLRNLNDERKFNKKLGRAFSRAYVFLPKSNFMMRTFFTRNWAELGSIQESPFGELLEQMPLIIRASASAGPEKWPIYYSNEKMGEIIGRILGAQGNWYFPELIPTLRVEGNPIEGKWPYH